MIYFIFTTCLIENDYELRQLQYTKGYGMLKKSIQQYDLQDYKIIIVENNGKRKTFLDEFDCDVYYTHNNSLQKEKGYKELQDIFDCIKTYEIRDDDFIVKITGRYIINETCEFMNILKNNMYDAIVRFGSYVKQAETKRIDDCVTGLIGMKCLFVKQIEYPLSHECVEWKWGKVTNHIHSDKIYIINKLDIYICPASNRYFLI
jgi:hypothetical protein